MRCFGRRDISTYAGLSCSGCQAICIDGFQHINLKRALFQEKGDTMIIREKYLSKIRPGMASTIKNGKCLGKIIDRNPGTKRLVECVIRIDFDND